MPDYLVVKLCANNGVYDPLTTAYGPVEYRPPHRDTPEEKEAINRSILQTNDPVNEQHSMRLSTIVLGAIDQADAEVQADSAFEEALDIISLENLGMADVRLMNSGFVKDLSSGRIIEINRRSLPRSGVYKTGIDGEYKQLTVGQYAMQRKDLDICQRYLRCLHWVRHSSQDTNPQMVFLFNWFAIEALLKIDVNDNVVPKIMLCLGFPGEKSKDVSKELLSALSSYQNYRSWREQIQGILEEMRQFRNDSVHSGFRMWDVPPEKIKKYKFLSLVSRVACIRIAETAIIANINSAQDLWGQAGQLLEQAPGVKKYLHDTVLWSLENGTIR